MFRKHEKRRAEFNTQVKQRKEVNKTPELLWAIRWNEQML